MEAYSNYKKSDAATFELVIVGEALWKTSLMKIEISDEIKETVHFTGHLPLEEFAKLMGAASVFSYVPYFEGFGIPLVEAMKCGTPILSGNLTSLPEVAEKAAIYCDPFNVQDIYEKMEEISTNEQLRNELSMKGLERAKLFSWDNSAEIVWNEILKITSV
jgi:glycosyltransferase involved in cell wall biosynthesis